MGARSERAVIVGIDGMIVRWRRTWPGRGWSDFEFLPGALDGLRLLKNSGHLVLVVDREDCTGRRESASERQRLMTRMRLEVALAGGRVDQVYDWRDGEIAYSELLKRVMAEHRLRASSASLVTDTVDELEAGAWLGCKGILLRRDAFLTGGWREVRQWREIASNLSDAAERLIRRGSVTLGELLEAKIAEATANHRNFFLRHVLVDCYGSWGERQGL